MFKTIIIDDELDIREGLKNLEVWEKNGFEIINTYENGIEALKQFKEIKPILVVTDIKMPGMDGLEFTRKIKEEKPDTYVIILSGFNYFEYARKSIKYGVEDYLLKPINVSELEKILVKISHNIEIEKLKQPLTEKEIVNIKMNEKLNSKNSIKIIIEWINQNSNKKLRLNEIAEEFHFHPFYLGQLIKEYTGKSFNSYINILRIKKAKCLLETTELKIETIGELVGYNFQDHFYRKFKSLVGVTPSEYRNKVK